MEPSSSLVGWEQKTSAASSVMRYNTGVKQEFLWHEISCIHDGSRSRQPGRAQADGPVPGALLPAAEAPEGDRRGSGGLLLQGLPPPEARLRRGADPGGAGPAPESPPGCDARGAVRAAQIGRAHV